jgi:uncharacterized protein YcfJ
MGGSGGSSSGSINYPEYMKYNHAYALGSSTDIGSGYAAAFTKPTNDIIELMNVAWAGASPFASYAAVDPDIVFFPTGEDVTDFQAGMVYQLLEDLYTYDADTDYTTYSTDAAVNSLTSAISDSLNDEVDEQVMPPFLAGHANMNSVMGSAFVIGKAMIANTKVREIAKQDGNIRTNVVLQRLSLKQELKRLSSVMGAEVGKLYLASKREEDDNNLNYAYRDVMFEMDVYKPYTQVRAAIAGSSTPNIADPSKPSALGGVVSGAAAGALVGSQITTGTGGADAGTGTLAGAIIGGSLGLASTL